VNNCQPRILYPAKWPSTSREKIKIFHDKDKLKQFMSTKPALQSILEGIIHVGQNEKQ
jgi:hypothetical protein